MKIERIEKFWELKQEVEKLKRKLDLVIKELEHKASIKLTIEERD